MITSNLNLAIHELVNDGIVAIPTETVYGLAGNARNETALRKIFILKNRPFYNPLIVHIRSSAYLNTVAQNIPEIAMKLARHFWPGPLTLVLEKQMDISDLVTAGKNTVAVRVPNHALTLELLNQLEFPLAAPSANPFGSISPTSAQHVQNYFGKKLKVIVEGGNCERGIESTIIGFEENQPVLYRHGSISMEEIEKVAGSVKVIVKNEHDPQAPGMLSRHYAPITTTYLTNNVPELTKQFPQKKIGVLMFKDSIKAKGIAKVEVLSEAGNIQEAAKNLYAALHRLDKANLDLIIAERFPNEDLGRSINDRLERAIKKG